MVRSGRGLNPLGRHLPQRTEAQRVMTDYDNTKKLSGIPPWPVHSHTRKGRSYVGTSKQRHRDPKAA
jgi:hypothetical protein